MFAVVELSPLLLTIGAVGCCCKLSCCRLLCVGSAVGCF